MPPSRKRRQGRARKAKLSRKDKAEDGNLANEEEDEKGLLKCGHGALDISQDQDNKCEQFIDDYVKDIEGLIQKAKKGTLITDAPGVGSMMSELHSKYPEVCNDTTNMAFVRAWLLSFGANLLKNRDSWCQIKLIAATVAGSVLYLENRGIFRTEGTDNSYMKLRDLTDSCDKRSIMKFFATRLPCSCLDALNAETKQVMPKSGVCDGCKQRKERSSLMICTGCMVVQYCSYTCQYACWHHHRRFCKKFCQVAEIGSDLREVSP